MSDTSENCKYKWTPDSTSLLVSVWSDKQVQKQFEYAPKPLLVWESVARYMRKKGYEVTARQCKSRMKQVLVCYKEAKKSGTNAGVERYYESVDKVAESKKMGKNVLKDNGIDTVDSIKILKSPPKDVKTNVNLQMQTKFGKSLLPSTEIYRGTWTSDHDEYADSSESNETVVVRPHRSMSPMKNVATNTITNSMPLNTKSARRSLPNDERFRYDNIEINRFSEIPLKNSVQNVQNQIIQENMMLRNQLAHENIIMQPEYHVNINNPNLRTNYTSEPIGFHPNRISTNMARLQTQLQQYAIVPNTAMPQEPRKLRNPHNRHENIEINTNYRPLRTYVDPYSSDIAPNLNDAFCQTSKNTKVHNLNETYDQPMFIENEIHCNDATAITNNATFNDDSISIEFLQDSPSPVENEGADSKNESLDNSICIPNAPVRMKKMQKLEQMMLNAITSQTEVVNKILEAQDVMVSKILDFDQDRQHRLENRLDQLMDVVQKTVTTKSNKPENLDLESDGIALLSPLKRPNCFSPPPMPGAAPPKLDLVPPKPCRVPCTSPSRNIELINQNPIQTRPGIIAPPKPGRIWEKLGPVSQSPFVKAQQQISAVTKAADHWRTKSSAERRIAQLVDSRPNTKIIIEESKKLLESEKLIEERMENARRMLMPEKDNSARRKLFQAPVEEQKAPIKEKQPSATVVLTQAFLDIEKQAEEKSRAVLNRFGSDSNNSDDLLTGQGESYEHLRRLSFKVKPNNKITNGYNPQIDTSTPAKCNDNNNNNNNNNYDNNNNNHHHHQAGQMIDDYGNEPRQTIQQLAELVMNSARWRNTANQHPPKLSVNFADQQNRHELAPVKPPRDAETQRQSVNKAREWLQDQCTYGVSKHLPNEMYTAQNYPIGFSTMHLNGQEDRYEQRRYDQQVQFNKDRVPKYGINNRELLDNERRNIERVRQENGKADKDDDDEEFLDTTTTLQPYRKPSLTSNGTAGTKSGSNCVIS